MYCICVPVHQCSSTLVHRCTKVSILFKKGYEIIEKLIQCYLIIEGLRSANGQLIIDSWPCVCVIRKLQIISLSLVAYVRINAWRLL